MKTAIFSSNFTSFKLIDLYLFYFIMKCCEALIHINTIINQVENE